MLREVKSIVHKRNQIIELCPPNMSDRLSLDLTGKRIHLSVQGGCGGTTFGLHNAVEQVRSGGRVLWASPEMPNATRFSQLFSSLNIVESSRFHALNLIGAMDRCVDAIVEARRSYIVVFSGKHDYTEKAVVNNGISRTNSTLRKVISYVSAQHYDSRLHILKWKHETIERTPWRSKHTGHHTESEALDYIRMVAPSISSPSPAFLLYCF